ncbi:MAG: hypothetical protein HQ546_08975 [Planctomycetes bacterium]|nr:hypothetical protein [Planctomycetota bacterium]
MIVKMQKLYAAVRVADKNRLLDSLRRQGVVHLEPVDPAAAVPGERTVTAIQRLQRAEQVLSSVTAVGEVPDVAPAVAADRALELFAKSAEGRTRLAALHRQVEQLAMWGDVRLETLESLRTEGVLVRFFKADAEDASKIPGECVEVVARMGKQVLVAVVDRGESEIQFDESLSSVRPVELPQRDRPAVLAEAKKIHEQLKSDGEEFARLAHHVPAIIAERRNREGEAAYIVADRGGLAGEALFAVQGWVPADAADELSANLRADGISAALQFLAPRDEDNPPTLLRYPRWARPMEGMFKILGTSPGYREFDVSGLFMIALPIFTAMLIADAGYGLLFLVPSIFFYKLMCRKAGKPLTQFITVIGVVSVIWGLITCTFFGVGAVQLTRAGGVWNDIYSVLKKVQLIGFVQETPADTMTSVRLTITRIAFLMGTIHMSIAQLWRSLRYWPNLKALSHVGWAVFLWGMLLVVNSLVLRDPLHPATAYLLIAGGAMAILFACPNRNIAKMVGLGFASFPLAGLSTLSDTISYIRLMAVGLASGILATTFNTLGATLAESATWFAGGAVILLGHALNVGLAIIAFFAHGVRLNMLEFSNNLGMAWNGHSYAPFSAQQLQEN